MGGSPNDDELGLVPPSTLGTVIYVFVFVVDLIGILLFTNSTVLTAESVGSSFTDMFTSSYNFGLSISDLAPLAILRFVCLFASLFVASRYRKDAADLYPPAPLPPKTSTTSSKTTPTKEEMTEARLDESWASFFSRVRSRPMLFTELSSLLSLLLCLAKSLARLLVGASAVIPSSVLQVEAGLWWFAVSTTIICSLAELLLVPSLCAAVAGKLQSKPRGYDALSSAGDHDVMLRDPLLAGSDLAGSPAASADVESGADRKARSSSCASSSDADGKGGSGSGSGSGIGNVPPESDDKPYKAGWNDLLRVCAPDLHLILFAFFNLVLAAVAQVYIPRFTGNILDSLNTNLNHDDDGAEDYDSVWDVPGFRSNVTLLAIAAVACGVFSGLRGAVFTSVGGNVNARLRTRLMGALLAHEIGFYDTTKIGDITSRLCSDTTLVGDQVTLNVNVFMRSFVQAIGVLAFMFSISWRLSLLAFVSVPAITLLSKWYGAYIRDLTVLTQKKLADANSVSAAALGSMPTVKAFGAEFSELAEYEKSVGKYLALNRRQAFAYFWYASAITAMPQLVTALILLYGGMLLRNDEITGGNLVSFLLYLSSLSDAFNQMGSIFSSLTQAVGAAEKVFELMHRKPKLRGSQPSSSGGNDHDAPATITTIRPRLDGLNPSDCRGAIELKDVVMTYPARPNREVLKGMNFFAPPGKVVALVGASGGGKSSVISLLQHLYEQQSGTVTIDGHAVFELSPAWLTKHVTVVSQEPTLYARSIARNIMFGLEGTPDEPTLEDIKAAAVLANADSFICGLPDGYETDVGERGVQLSGGQKQRIAIARALVRKPCILLLDEFSSALDAESEALVQDAIDRMLGRGDFAATRKNNAGEGMTVVVVAHRL